MRVSPALGMCAVRQVAEPFENEREASDFAKGFVDEDDCGYRRTKLLTKGHAGH